jgi:hypothetical protein
MQFKQSDCDELLEIFKRKYGHNIFLSTYRHGDIDQIDCIFNRKDFVQIFYKKDNFLILSVVQKRKELLDEFQKIINKFMKCNALCSYDLKLYNTEQPHMKSIKEWWLTKKKERIDELKNKKVYKNMAEIMNFKGQSFLDSFIKEF